MKIGYSREPEARLRELMVGNPQESELLGFHPGTMRDERFLHRYFSCYHHKLEWFHCCDEIIRVARSGLPKMITAPKADSRLPSRPHLARRIAFEIRHTLTPVRKKFRRQVLEVLARETVPIPEKAQVSAPISITRHGHMLNTRTSNEQLTWYLEQKRESNAGSLAAKAEISHYQASNAIKGRPVSAIAYLRIAAAIGFDPLPSVQRNHVELQDFRFQIFALAFARKRASVAHTVRATSAVTGLSIATISRLEHGDPMHIGVVLAGCEYIESHPFDFMVEHGTATQLFTPPPRETCAETR